MIKRKMLKNLKKETPAIVQEGKELVDTLSKKSKEMFNEAKKEISKELSEEKIAENKVDESKIKTKNDSTEKPKPLNKRKKEPLFKKL